MSLFPGTPGLESRNCPEIVPGGVPRLWELITPDCEVWSRQGLNQTCSPRQDLSNDVSQSQFGGRKEVDSRLLVVGSQTASLTPGPSVSHNLGCRCPNGQCAAIFDIYASRPFQWHQENLNARCFRPWCRTLNIQESRRTPNPQLWKCWASPPHLAKVGLRNLMYAMLCTRPDLAYPISVLSQHMANPSMEHWMAIKRIFWYLQGTLQMKLQFGATPSKEMFRYCDADWGGDLEDRSTTGFVFMMGGGAISWSSKQ